MSTFLKPELNAHSKNFTIAISYYFFMSYCSLQDLMQMEKKLYDNLILTKMTNL